jgi:oligopeptide/dipeptide ABC transporter ATP-binding protein
MPVSTQPLLEIRNLKTFFAAEEGMVRAIDGLDLSVRRGETFGLVGESGCGKSVTALSILRLVDPPGRIAAGEILFDGVSLLDLPERAMRELRGSRISMIFQEPQSSFNPVYPIGRQIAEVFRIHQNMAPQAAWERAVALLRLVGIPNAESKARAFPHEVSGGQAQRVMVAMALALDPELLIADEPTTALDVTIQAQILDLIRDLSRRRHTTVILINHDLSVVAEMCQRAAVMYAGHIVEEAGVQTLFGEPLHPYTRGLINSMPLLGRMPHRLETISGTVPRRVDEPSACRFASRCRARQEHGLAICDREEPALIQVRPHHAVRCWLYQDGEGHRAPIPLAKGEKSGDRDALLAGPGGVTHE